MTEAVLFDLDGTLLDTVADIGKRVNETLRRYSYPEISLEKTRAFVGNGARTLITRALPKGAENAEECYRYFRSVFAADGAENTRPFAGAREALARLKARGVRLAVVTNKPQDATQALIGRFFPDTFDYTGGDSGLFPCKPDPAHALYAALTLRVPPARCVFVGDGETDVLTAKNAGMRGIAALWGYRTKEQLRAAGAELFAEDFPALEKILQNV